MTTLMLALAPQLAAVRSDVSCCQIQEVMDGANTAHLHPLHIHPPPSTLRQCCPILTSIIRYARYTNSFSVSKSPTQCFHTIYFRHCQRWAFHCLSTLQRSSLMDSFHNLSLIEDLCSDVVNWRTLPSTSTSQLSLLSESPEPTLSPHTQATTTPHYLWQNLGKLIMFCL